MEETKWEKSRDASAEPQSCLSRRKTIVPLGVGHVRRNIQGDREIVGSHLDQRQPPKRDVTPPISDCLLILLPGKRETPESGGEKTLVVDYKTRCPSGDGSCMLRLGLSIGQNVSIA